MSQRLVQYVSSQQFTKMRKVHFHSVGLGLITPIMNSVETELTRTILELGRYLMALKTATHFVANSKLM